MEILDLSLKVVDIELLRNPLGKILKSDQCAICLQEEPKVLFCDCGHLCICKKCLVCRFDNCPVCKERITLFRIIE